MTPKRKIQRGLVWAVAGASAFGLGIGATSLVSAASSSTTDTAVVSTNTGSSTGSNTVLPPLDQTGTPPADDANRPDPASLPNGPGETVLTGDDAAKVTEAALAAEPGATVVRIETDTNGHAFEAHVQLADGSYKTLYFTADYAADGSETGFGPGGPGGPCGPGHHGHHG